MMTKDYNIRTYAGGPYCNHITYRIKNIEGLPPLVWCKDPMFSYTAEDKYPWHATSLHICVEEMLYADIYDEEHEALKKYSVKKSYTIRSTEYCIYERYTSDASCRILYAILYDFTDQAYRECLFGSINDFYFPMYNVECNALLKYKIIP